MRSSTRPAPLDALATMTKRLDRHVGVGDPDLPRPDWVTMVPLDRLVMEHQPRELIPEETLQHLIAAGENRPAGVLAALRETAAVDSYYAAIHAGLEELARSIESQGVLQPIQVALTAGPQLVVRDGHRRCLASLLAGQLTIPALRVEEASELEAVARAFIVNLQRQDLTAVEKGAALLRLALLMGKHLAQERGDDPAAVTIEALVADAGDEEATVPEGVVTVTGLPRELAAEVRDRVCQLVGIGRRTYYNYLALNRLTPEARARGRSLPEGKLRHLVRVPQAKQAETIEFVQRHHLSDEAVKTLTRVIRAGDADEVEHIMARLSKERIGQARASVSWEKLLFAIPEDYAQRGEALRAELAALTPERRATRLGEIKHQLPRLAAVQALFEALLAQYQLASEQADR